MSENLKKFLDLLANDKELEVKALVTAFEQLNELYSQQTAFRQHTAMLLYGVTEAA